MKILYCGYFEYKNQEKHNIEGPYCPNPKSRRKENARDEEEDYYTLRKYYERDSAYLGLINAFIQDGPQLILQLYILAVRDHDALSDAYTGINICNLDIFKKIQWFRSYNFKSASR